MKAIRASLRTVSRGFEAVPPHDLWAGRKCDSRERLVGTRICQHGEISSLPASGRWGTSHLLGPGRANGKGGILIWIVWFEFQGFCKLFSFLWVPRIEVMKYCSPNSGMFHLRSRPWLNRKAYLYPSFPIYQWSHLPRAQPFSPACWTSAV